MSTSKTYDLGENPLKFGQDEIRGCTVLLIVSKYAVYQAHLWEVPSMRINEGGRLVPNEKAFQQNIPPETPAERDWHQWRISWCLSSGLYVHS